MRVSRRTMIVGAAAAAVARPAFSRGDSGFDRGRGAHRVGERHATFARRLRAGNADSIDAAIDLALVTECLIDAVSIQIERRAVRRDGTGVVFSSAGPDSFLGAPSRSFRRDISAPFAPLDYVT